MSKEPTSYLQHNPRLLDIWSDLIVLNRTLSNLLSHARNSQDREYVPDQEEILKLLTHSTVCEKAISDKIFIVLDPKP